MKRILTILTLAVSAFSAMAQTVGEAFYVYRNDGEFNAFFRDEVQSMSYSCYDLDSIQHEEIVTQVIYTADSIYKIPLEVIDSVSFIQPENKYVPGLVRMEPLIPYITSVDGMNFTIAANTPSNLIPHDGDVLLYENFENGMFPSGFAGRVNGIDNMTVSCDSVSFSDIYENYVCFGDYTLEDDESESGIRRLKPKKIAGHVSAGLDLGAHLGNDNLSVDINGRLGLDLRVILKFQKTAPLYFEMSLAPSLRLGVTAGVEGKINHNFLDKNKLKLRLPIPDTPLLLGISGGPLVKTSLEASLKASTQGEIGFRLGIKYTDGHFVPICENTSKGFSTPEMEGSIDGKLFIGQQIEFGVYSYGDILSAVIEKEAGIELGANLSADLMNSDRYGELTKGKVDLNIKASIGGKAELKIWKLLSLTSRLTLGSVSVNLNSWKIVPTFSTPNVNTDKAGKATIAVQPSEKLIIPVGIGIGVYDEDDNLVDMQFSQSNYRVPGEWGDGKFEHTFSSLQSGKTYKAVPLVKFWGMNIMATPSATFTVEEEQLCPDSNHPHAIDLGIGVKFACCNVGASAPWEYGGYYAWGETEEKNYYDWDSYKHCDSYNGCHNLGLDIAGTQYDVAHVKWGGKWKMPSYEQLIRLTDNCTSTWTQVNGISGRKFVGPNGNSIFLPAAGDRWLDNTGGVGYGGIYWSSAQYPYNSNFAYYLYFDSGDVYTDYSSRFYGLSVRPVTDQ